MTNAEIGTAIRRTLAGITWDELPAPKIALPNRSFTIPNPPAPWLRLSIHGGQTDEAEKGPGGVGIGGGVAMVSIFTPAGEGTGRGERYADIIEAAYRRGSVDGVDFGESYSTHAGNDDENDGYFHILTTIPFENFK